MRQFRLRWPVYRVYDSEYDEFVGIWFRWPVGRRWSGHGGLVGSGVPMTDFAPLLLASLKMPEPISQMRSSVDAVAYWQEDALR